MREPVGLILAGGRGSRMGGTSKADVRLCGRRLLDHVTERFEPQVAALALSANTPVKTGLPVLADTQAGFLGPLAGILAGLDWAQARGASHMVSVAVDTPFFPADLVPRLLMAGEGHPAGLAVATTTDGQHGTFAVWPVALRDDLAGFLARGGRKVREWTQAQGAAHAPFPDTTPPAFFNINTPADLQQAAVWM